MKVLSFTTIPSRIDKIGPMVDSLLNQTAELDKIHLWLPREPRRGSWNGKSIPNFIKNSGIRCRFREDLGPFTKLGPTLKEYSDPETKIITLDDDRKYNSKLVERLLHYSEKFENSAIGPRGKKLEGGPSYRYSRSEGFWNDYDEEYKEVDIITSTGGVLYRRKFFDDRIFELDDCKSSYINDDLWVMGHLARRGIRKLCVNTKLPQDPTTDAHQIDRISSIYSEHNNRLLEYFEEHW